MVLLVPFDGSDLAEAALERADEFASLVDEDVVVLTVFPDEGAYARHHGWVDIGESYDPAALADAFESRVDALASDATYRTERVAADADQTVVAAIAARIRSVAADVDASILFIGSDDAGTVASPITSVGNPLSADPRYDVHIVRHPN